MVFLHYAADFRAHRNETSQTTSSRGLEDTHTLLLLCAPEVLLYSTPPCASALPLVNSFVPLRQSSVRASHLREFW